MIFSIGESAISFRQHLMFFLGLREVLSMVFCGWTPMDAGVNCVRDQCMAVVYLRVYIYI